MSNERVNGVASVGGGGGSDSADDSQAGGFVAIGLELVALGNTLAATGQLARRADRDKRKAVLATAIPVIAGIIGDLEILRLGLRNSVGR